MCCCRRVFLTPSMIFVISFSRSSFFFDTRSFMFMYVSFSRNLNARSSSSAFIGYIPSFSAIGAYMVIVSPAIILRMSSGRYFNVRMLCSLSIIFIIMTRISFELASIILRMFSALLSCSASGLKFLSTFLSLDNACIRTSVSLSNSFSIVSGFTFASSITACSNPAATVCEPSLRSESIIATLYEYVKKSSPERRFFSCNALYENCTAFSIKAVLVLGLYERILSNNSLVFSLTSSIHREVKESI